MSLPLPDTVRHRAVMELDAFCEKRIPGFVRDQVRLEYEFRGNTVILVERRVPWRPAMEGEPWTRTPIARFRYGVNTGRWTLYWPDRNTRWHIDQGVHPARDLAPLLVEVDRDPTAIYWG